jgi:hypothetical protein
VIGANILVGLHFRVMNKLGRYSLAVAVAALVAAATMVAPSRSDDPARAADAPASNMPVIVELFTSQGCSSCPPADAFLGELASRPDVVALAMHVDYWDYIGWKDPFAKRMYTERQRDYARSLWQRFVYTPQMVVDGRYQDVGSDRHAINKLIERALADKAKQPLVQITQVDEPQSAGSPSGPPAKIKVESIGFRGTASVWLALYDREHQTQVQRGENAGRRLVDYNVVREFRRIGTFDGRSVTLALELGELAGRHDAGVVFVQQDGTGPILSCFGFDAGGGKRAGL